MTGDRVWYGDTSFGLLDNGSWGGFAWVGGYCYDDGIGTDCAATIDLGGSYSSVGGFMNYAREGESFSTAGAVPGAPTIAAIAADGTTVLESYDLDALASISTPGGFNAGAFRGISRAAADIRYFRISGAYLIAHDLTLPGGGAIPEPGSVVLFGLGLGAAVAFRRKLVR